MNDFAKIPLNAGIEERSDVVVVNPGGADRAKIRIGAASDMSANAAMQVRMSASLLSRGDEQVGQLVDLTEIEAAATIYLRMWYTSAKGKAKVQQNFSMGLGPCDGQQALDAFERLCFFVVQHGGQNISPSPFGCPCVTASEAVFANFVALAASGQCEETLALAGFLVGAEAADTIASCAETFGQALLSISQLTQRGGRGGNLRRSRPN